MKRSLNPVAVGLVLLALTLSVANATEQAIAIAPMRVLSNRVDCEGNACAHVTLTFDEGKQQYRVQNNSERLVRVEASNLAGSNRILVEAGKEAYLAMKSIIGPYRANFE